MAEATFNSALLNQPATLQSVLKAASRASEIALDTEADSMHAYPEKVCLIQIRIGKQSWLLDPLLDMDLGPLMEVFARKSLLSALESQGWIALPWGRGFLTQFPHNRIETAFCGASDFRERA